MKRLIFNRFSSGLAVLGIVSIAFVFGMSLLAIENSNYKVQNDVVETGKVNWSVDLAAAKKKSKETGRPILVLFQEIPG